MSEPTKTKDKSSLNRRERRKRRKRREPTAFSFSSFPSVQNFLCRIPKRVSGRKNPVACLTRRGVRVCWLKSLSLNSKKRQRSFRCTKRVPFANAWALREPGEVASTALTQGRRTTGDNLVAPALDSVSPQTAGAQNRRERFRDLSIGPRSTISKCFGTPPVYEANHIADRLQCSCQRQSLPNRHTHLVPVAERQRLHKSVMESRLSKDLQSPADCPSELDERTHFRVAQGTASTKPR